MNRFVNKIIIVTGGTRGIGLAISELLAKEGANVIACARNETSFSSKNIYFEKLDVSNENECLNLFTKIVKKYGRIDGLVCNAGITNDSLTEYMTNEMFDNVINVNLKGTFNLVKYLGPYMVKQGYGSIVNISSIVGECGNIGQANYAASKSGLIGMSLSWAKEFSRKGAQVRVNVVSPGFIKTDMLASVPEHLLDKFKKQIMLQRFGSPEEVANVVSFLLSEESSYITGSVINVNGGLRI